MFYQMKSAFRLVLFATVITVGPVVGRGSPDQFFDAGPFGVPLPDGQGLKWDDPREIHSVIVNFAGPIPAGGKLRLEYWGSHWPEQHLPKDRVLGSGFSGWMELGNWYNGGWRVADTEQSVSSNSIQFTFHPINVQEYPGLKDYASTGRFTLKIRIASEETLPQILGIRALTDSTIENRSVRVVWEHPPASNFQATAFNGQIVSVTPAGSRATTLLVQTSVNSDPNTFDRTLVTLRNGTNVFTFKMDDLKDGSLYLPEYGAAILPDNDHRDYPAVAQSVQRAGQKTLYDRISEMPEQTWTSAWNGMPPKKSRIAFVLGMDGARQKFRLDANGDVSFRQDDQYMKALPARDTPRLDLEKPPMQVRFGLPENPVERHIEDESIPICVTTWDRDGIRIVQTAFATMLDGVKADGPPPAPDACAVAMLRFDFTNTTDVSRVADLPISILSDTNYEVLRLDDRGLIWNGHQLRGQSCRF